MPNRKNASDIGNESNSCFALLKYVLLTWDVSVLGTGPVIALTITSILLVAYTALTLQELWSFYRARKAKRLKMQKAKDDEGLPLPVTTPCDGESGSSDRRAPTPTILVTPTDELQSPARSNSQSSGAPSSLHLRVDSVTEQTNENTNDENTNENANEKKKRYSRRRPRRRRCVVCGPFIYSFIPRLDCLSPSKDGPDTLTRCS